MDRRAQKKTRVSVNRRNLKLSTLDPPHTRTHDLSRIRSSRFIPCGHIRHVLHEASLHWPSLCKPPPWLEIGLDLTSFVGAWSAARQQSTLCPDCGSLCTLLGLLGVNPKDSRCIHPHRRIPSRPTSTSLTGRKCFVHSMRR